MFYKIIDFIKRIKIEFNFGKYIQEDYYMVGFGMYFCNFNNNKKIVIDVLCFYVEINFRLEKKKRKVRNILKYKYK